MSEVGLDRKYVLLLKIAARKNLKMQEINCFSQPRQNLRRQGGERERQVVDAALEAVNFRDTLALRHRSSHFAFLGVR